MGDCAHTKFLLDSLGQQNDVDVRWLQQLAIAHLTIEVGIVRGSAALICPQFDELDGRESTLEGRIKSVISGLVGRTMNMSSAAVGVVSTRAARSA